jgi:alpha-1,3-glucosyltransferase
MWRSADGGFASGTRPSPRQIRDSPLLAQLPPNPTQPRPALPCPTPQSWLHGKMVAAVEPAAVALGTSRGYETPTSKALLRWTVVLSDAATFFPAALAAARLLRPPPSAAAAAAAGSELFVLAALLLNPANVLTDHGHFQYNCISLGFALGAAVAIAARGWHVLGSVLFCGALCHKQMSLFYAPAFFAHLLGRCLERPGVARKVSRGDGAGWGGRGA